MVEWFAICTTKTEKSFNEINKLLAHTTLAPVTKEHIQVPSISLGERDFTNDSLSYFQLSILLKT